MASASVYPAGIVLALISGITMLLDIPPLIWHINHRNTAPATLILWLVVLNFTNVLNVILWPNDNLTPRSYHGEGICDVEVKVYVASWVAVPCAFASILRSLTRVMDPENIVLSPSKAQKRREMVIDLLITWACPIYLMPAHYIVQPNRFNLTSISGCVPSFDESWPDSMLVFIWPCIIVLIACYYSGLLMYRLRAYRRTMHLLLQSHNTNKSRFIRLALMALIFIFILTPLQFYVFYTNLAPQHQPYSWSTVHNPATWNQIQFAPSNGTVVYDRWIRPGAGILVFIFFGVGHDACTMYRQWLLRCGLGTTFPSLTDDNRRARKSARGLRNLSGSTGTWSSISARTKDLFQRKWTPFSLVSQRSSSSSATSKRTSIGTTLRERLSWPTSSKSSANTVEVNKKMSYASAATQTDEVSLHSIIASPMGKFSLDGATIALDVLEANATTHEMSTEAAGQEAKRQEKERKLTDKRIKVLEDSEKLEEALKKL